MTPHSPDASSDADALVAAIVKAFNHPSITLNTVNDEHGLRYEIICDHPQDVARLAIAAIQAQQPAAAPAVNESTEKLLNKPASKLSNEEYQKVDEWIWANTPDAPAVGGDVVE